MLKRRLVGWGVSVEEPVDEGAGGEVHECSGEADGDGVGDEVHDKPAAAGRKTSTAMMRGTANREKSRAVK